MGCQVAVFRSRGQAGLPTAILRLPRIRVHQCVANFQSIYSVGKLNKSIFTTDRQKTLTPKIVHKSIKMVAPPGQNTKVQPIKPGEKGLKC